MLEIIFDNWKDFSKIFLITIIFLIINIYLIITSTKNYIIDNWGYFKTKSWIVLFSGFIKKDDDKNIMQTTLQNIISFLWSIVNKLLRILIRPFYSVMDLIVNVMKLLVDNINKLRQQFKIMRNFFFRIIKKVYDRIQNSVAAITIYFLRMREGLKRNIGLFKLLSLTITNSYFFLISMVNGPIAKVGWFAEKFGLAMAGFTLGFPGIAIWQNLCFDPDTVIKLNNNLSKKIIDININDILINNNKILATCIFDINQYFEPIYDYKNVIVSGNHIVKENNKFIRIKDSNLSNLITYKKNKLVCLVTELGLIEINSILFKDYLDTHNKYINQDIQRIVEQKLNNENENSIFNEKMLNYDRNSDLLSGIAENTYIFDIKKNKYIKISDLNIGDKINDTNIIGRININKKFITPYLYKNDDNLSIVLSGNQLIKENNKWIRASFSIYTTKINYNNTLEIPNFINFVTTNNKISINNLVLADFLETKDYMTNQIIDELIDQDIAPEYTRYI